jgi:hypothetical protein
MYRCYSEKIDYELEDLGDGAFLTGCPLCGTSCWDLPEETRNEIDSEMDKTNEANKDDKATNGDFEYENEYE